ncbi:MAG: tRNA uracil 4-sulfurtransferase ThiI, partial [Oscillospiraceae bacterium]
MKEIILAKYGEIALKGLNKKTFEDVLVKNIRQRLKMLGKFNITRAQSTIYLEPLSEDIDIDEAVIRLQKIFGIAKVCRTVCVEKSWEAIAEITKSCFFEALTSAKTFKVQAKRADKKFPMSSPQICTELGGILLEEFPQLKVDVHNPEVTVTVEIRERGAYIRASEAEGAGGMPVSTSGKALLLLSGGIDSPVAGYMLAKRGVWISAVHFESPPYTSERARMKVERLASIMAEYCGSIHFYCVPFTKIQEEIRKNCPEEFFTLIMRRLMMELAQRIAENNELSALVTGESVGQVASQTMGAIVCTDQACRMPVFRPV